MLSARIPRCSAAGMSALRFRPIRSQGIVRLCLAIPQARRERCWRQHAVDASLAVSAKPGEAGHARNSSARLHIRCDAALENGLSQWCREPHTAHDHRQQRSGRHHGPVGPRSVHSSADGRSDRGGEERHRGHRPNAKRADVEDCGARGRQGERRQDAKEVRASGDAVEDAHAEGGVRVSQSSNPCRVRPAREHDRATPRRARATPGRRAGSGSAPTGRCRRARRRPCARSRPTARRWAADSRAAGRRAAPRRRRPRRDRRPTSIPQSSPGDGRQRPAARRQPDDRARKERGRSRRARR